MTSLAALFVLALQVAPQASDAAAIKPRTWEHESSDLPVIPRVHFGAFKNGMRWAWMENAEPKERVYLRLHVNAGSFGETDSELGAAHFLEHMAFNESRHFKPGTLVEWLQKHGLGFGGDTNAFTDFSQTVYMLDLPTDDDAMIADGLIVLRDVADGLLLSDVEVQAEKGVIDGEERERDSARWRVTRQTMEKLYAGSLVPLRIPIGTKAARDAFSAASLRTFYERWYRPENFTLILVGDLKGHDPQKLLDAAFADLKAPATPPALEPARGAAALATRAFVIHDAEIPSVTLTIEALKPWVDEPDTKATRLKDLARDHAREILNLRLTELAKKPDAPFVRARASEGGGMQLLDGEELAVTCEPTKWKEALASVQLELRKALLHGFDAAELDEVRKNELRELDERVASEPTETSAEWVHELLTAAEIRYVPVDATTRRGYLKPALEALTVEQCHQAFAKAWSEGTLVVGTAGALDLGPDGEKQLTDAWAAGNKGEVAAAAKEATAAWGYAADPAKAGKVADRKHEAEFDFERVVFENGVRLYAKKTDFTKREVLVRALVGEGGLASDPKESALRQVAQSTFAKCALGKHSADELRRLTAGKAVGMQFGVLDDEFVLGGETTVEDLGTQCELLCAYLTDPGFREDGVTQFRRALPQDYEARKHQPGWPLGNQFYPVLYGGDPRRSMPTLESLEAVTLDDMKRWITPAFDAAPIDLLVVGDVDVDSVVAAAAKTFGALPKRRARNEWNERRVLPPMKAGVHESYSVDTQIPKAVVLLQFATADGRDAVTRRNLSFLGNVVNDRLRVEIREKLGAAYSPRANSSSSLVYPGDGAVVIQALADPKDADMLADACLAVADKLATSGVTDEEVDRLRGEVLARLRDALRTNPFWIDVLGNFHADRPVLDDLKSLIPHHEKLKAAALTELAKKYLKKELASIAIVRPAAGEKGLQPGGGR